MFSPKKVLFIGAHPDDIEIGCGGTIVKFLEEGRTVNTVVFSLVNPAVSMDPAILLNECKESFDRLGIKRSNGLFFNYEMRQLTRDRQSILQELFDVKDKLKPDLVLIPSPNDLHQDHATVSKEGMRAFKETTTLAYELPWNNLVFKSQVFLTLTEKQVNKKMYAVSAYVSQAYKHYMKNGFLKAVAQMEGGRVGVDYAEAYEAIRWVI